jgi:dipeptidyl aminopeptidase/acylaminoacyl peptidase
MMMESLKKRGIPVACLMFPGEQHGFRGGDTIRRCLDGELYFYSKVLGFKIPADVAQVEITNLSMRY